MCLLWHRNVAIVMLISCVYFKSAFGYNLLHWEVNGCTVDILNCVFTFPKMSTNVYCLVRNVLYVSGSFSDD